MRPAVGSWQPFSPQSTSIGLWRSRPILIVGSGKNRIQKSASIPTMRELAWSITHRQNGFYVNGRRSISVEPLPQPLHPAPGKFGQADHAAVPPVFTSFLCNGPNEQPGRGTKSKLPIATANACPIPFGISFMLFRRNGGQDSLKYVDHQCIRKRVLWGPSTGNQPSRRRSVRSHHRENGGRRGQAEWIVSFR